MGLVMALLSLRSTRGPEQIVPFRRFVFIGAAFAFFALAIEPLGLLGTLFVTTVVGAYADAEARAGQTLVLATCLTAAIWLVFVRLLGVAIPPLPQMF